MKGLITKAKEKAYFLKAINKRFENSIYINKYNKLLRLEQKIKSKIVFSISDNLKQDYFKNMVITKLNSLGFKTSKHESIQKIKMKHKIRYFKYKEWYTAKVDTILQIISNGKIIKSYQQRVVGKSVSSNNEALINASKRFKVEF